MLNIEAVFNATPLSIDADEEALLIEAALRGSEQATMTLILAYLPALRNAVGRFEEVLGVEDARQTALLAFLELLREFDPVKGDRLAGLVRHRLTRALSEAAVANAFTVPERTRQRFLAILRKAEGDLTVALDLCGEFGMARETFMSIFHVERNTGSLDAAGVYVDPDSVPQEVEAFPLDGRMTYADDDALLVELAFSVVDDLETDVCRLAYGFTDYEPVADGEIGHRLGLSRPKVQRVRSAALSKMRSALGA